MQAFYKNSILLPALCCLFSHLLPLNTFSQLVVDPSFNPSDVGTGLPFSANGTGFNGPVYAVVSGTSDTYFFGTFTRFNGAVTGNCAHFSNHTLDLSFPKITFLGGEVSKAIQSTSGDIFVIGNFLQIRSESGSSTTTVPHPAGMGKISSGGIIDVGFRNGLDDPFGATGKITDVQLVGSPSFVYIAGNFTSFSESSGVVHSRPYFARINPSNGSYEAGSVPIAIPIGSQAAGDSIISIEVDPSESFVLVGGKFNNLFSSAFTPVTNLNGVFKFNLLTGSVDFSFTILPFSGKVLDMQLLSDSGALIAGKFDAGTFQNLAKISIANGNILTGPNLNPGPAGSFVSRILEVQPGLKYLVGGLFSSPRSNLAMVNSDGVLQATFSAAAGSNGEITCLSLTPGGNIIAGGLFTEFGGKPRRFASLFSTSGALVSPPLYPTGGASGQVYAQLPLPNGRTYVAGSFNGYNDVICNGFLRILPNGEIDGTFLPGSGFNGSVHALALSNGSVICAGKFSSFNGSARSGVVRLLASGTLDPAFNAGGTSDSVLCAVVQADGKILLGGNFTSFSGQPRSRIVRLNADGSIDNTFIIGNGFDNTVRSIVLSGALIYVGGDFTSFNGNSRRGVVCLNSNGTFNASANTGSGINASGTVRSVFRNPVNGALYAGGRFSQFNGENLSNLVKILPDGQPDATFTASLDGEVYDLMEGAGGRGLIVALGLGQSKATPKGLVKLKPKGGKAFGINTNGPVFSLKRDSSGKIIITGNFNMVDTVGKTRIARILETALETTIWDGSEWDWEAPDCDFGALINGHYQNQPGFICKTLTILPSYKFFPDSTVWVCRNAYNYGNQISGKIYLKDLNADTVHHVEGIFDDMTLDDDSGAVVTYPATILGTLKLKKGVFETSDQLTLKSTFLKTGRIGKIETGADLSGQITMERRVPGGTAGWHFLGTPIKNQVQSNWSDDFLILPNFIFRHDEGLLTDSGWVQTTDSLKVGKGFRVFLNNSFFNSYATFRNTGIPHKGNFSFNVSYTPGGYGGGGWNFLSNPYPSEIDWVAFSRTNINESVHYWDGNIYGSYNAILDDSINGASRYIPSSQAFFVKATAASPALSVTESAKPDSAYNPGFFRIAANAKDYFARIKLFGTNQASDETLIRWMDGALPVFEDRFDAHKLKNPGLNLYSNTSDGKKTGIQARNYGAADSIDIGVSVPAAGNYMLEMKLGEGLLTERNLAIRDNSEKTYFKVSAGLKLPFSVHDGELDLPKRFTLLLRPQEDEFPENLIAPKLFAFPNPGSETFRIFGLVKEESFSLEQINGKAVLQGKTDGLLNLSGITPGLYFLRFPENQSITERLKILVIR